MSSIFPDEPNDEEELERLPEDGETPFRPAQDDGGEAADEEEIREADSEPLDDTHQVTDTNLQAEEEYDEGLSGAAEADEPNVGNAVVGYDPTKDQRRRKPDDSDDEGM
jgi:hypothetical protein